MQAEDHYRLSSVEDKAKIHCLWNTSRSKYEPWCKKKEKVYMSYYNTHMKALKNAFEPGVFGLWSKEGIGFGVYASKNLSQAKKENQKEIHKLWGKAVSCKVANTSWSLVQKAAIKTP